jgi:hypothetical protein
VFWLIIVFTPKFYFFAFRQGRRSIERLGCGMFESSVAEVNEKGQKILLKTKKSPSIVT